MAGCSRVKVALFAAGWFYPAFAARGCAVIEKPKQRKGFGRYGPCAEDFLKTILKLLTSLTQHNSRKVLNVGSKIA